MPLRFSRTIVNFWLDLTLLVVFLILCWSSVILRFVFPAGTQATGWSLWGWDYVWWCDFQFASLCLLALGILVHVMLHWSWVCGVVISRWGAGKASPAAKRDDGSRTLWGVALIIVIMNVLGLGIAVAALMIDGPVY